MPLARSPENIPQLSAVSDDCPCAICQQVMQTKQDCLITLCNHVFHKVCIDTWLKEEHECPCCRRLCHIKDCVPISITKQLGSFGNRQQYQNQRRGMGRRPATRSYTNSRKNLSSSFRDMSTDNRTLQSSFHNASMPLIDVSEQNSSRQAGSQQPPSATSVDYGRVSQIVEESVARLLSQLNVNSAQNNDARHPASSQQRSLNALNLNSQTFPNVRPDKTITIIQNWNVKYDGSTDGLTVDEFIYRVSALTQTHLNNDFSLLCKNIHMLLNGRARDWYWRYHKQTEVVEWQGFCAALKYQFKNYRSNFDIREQIRSRKQKPGESFETFYDAICVMCDRLSIPIDEEEFIEILIRNLKPEIRHELLYINVRSVAHLRKLCQMRENLLADENYRRSQPFRNSQPVAARRNISAIDDDPCVEEMAEEETQGNVAAVQQILPSKCWNCQEEGHHWQDCLSARTIFCYGCGEPETYKPQCSVCTPRRMENFQRGASRNKRVHPK